MQEVSRELYVLDRKQIKLSSIPLQVLYNKKVERIRAIEYSENKPPEPIRFDIQDSLTGKKNLVEVKLECKSAPKAYSFEIDFDDPNL